MDKELTATSKPKARSLLSRAVAPVMYYGGDYPMTTYGGMGMGYGRGYGMGYGGYGMGMGYGGGGYGMMGGYGG